MHMRESGGRKKKKKNACLSLIHTYNKNASLTALSHMRIFVFDVKKQKRAHEKAVKKIHELLA